MKATENQEQIAKELCLKLLEQNFFAAPAACETLESYNSEVGKQVGIMYQSILDEITKTNE